MKLTCPVCRAETANTQLPKECENCGAPLRSYARLSAHGAGLFNRGLAAAQEGHLTKARGYFSAIVYWCPADLEARNALGMACFQLGDHAEARRLWEAILAEAPNNAMAKDGLAVIDNRKNAVGSAGAQADINSRHKHKKRKNR